MAFPSNPIYKLVNHPITGELVNIRTATDDFIPLDEANTDYQEYLEWVAEENTPEAAD
tara:strand:- start:183 stop:356 length:174 start_codon:yes stop_codon:yes gene_type:complete